MAMILRMILVFFSLYTVSGLTLTVQTNYLKVGESGVTMECNLDGAPWNIHSQRRWTVPPNTQTAIYDGSANTGYTEDLSDAATLGIIRMTTPPLKWNIENELFQCLYSFDAASLNATRSILARHSGSGVTYDGSTKKCVFSVSEILPSPSKSITLVKISVQSDITADLSRVTETLTNNNDQGQTYSYRIKVDGSDLNKGDQVIFHMKAGPYSVNKTFEISGCSGLGLKTYMYVIAIPVMTVAILTVSCTTIVFFAVKKNIHARKIYKTKIGNNADSDSLQRNHNHIFG